MLESSGYGLSALAYIKALSSIGVDVYWSPLVFGPNGYRPWTQFENAKANVESILYECVGDSDEVGFFMSRMQRIKQYDTTIMHTIPEYWPLLKQDGKRNIGYTVWETTRLPEHFPKLINSADKVWVPSNFNVPIFKESGVTIPIDVIPHILNECVGADFKTIENMRQKYGINQDQFVFYSINSWNARKSLDVLLRCYFSAFTTADPVHLILKTSETGPADALDLHHHDTRLLAQNISDEFLEPAAFSVIPEKLSNDEITAIHALGDCYVSTSHSEGWGLGAFEAAGCGNPVIMTAWGGQLDFLSSDLSYLVDYTLVSVCDKLGEASYSSNQQWAEVSEQHVVDSLREVFVRRELAQQRAQALSEKLKQEFNPSSIGAALLKAIYD